MLGLKYDQLMLLLPPPSALRKFFPSKNAWSILIYGEMNVTQMQADCIRCGYDAAVVEKSGKILDYKECKNCRVFLREIV